MKKQMLVFVFIILLAIIAISLFYLTSRKMVPSSEINETEPATSDVEFRTSKNSYQRGDRIKFTVTNNLSKPITHGYSCSIGQCTKYDGEFECTRLPFLRCQYDTIEPSKKTELEYVTQTGEGATKFIFYYTVIYDTHEVAREVFSNEIVLLKSNEPSEELLIEYERLCSSRLFDNRAIADEITQSNPDITDAVKIDFLRVLGLVDAYDNPLDNETYVNDCVNVSIDEWKSLQRKIDTLTK